MPPAADSLLSSSARPLDIRVRSDLTARRQQFQGRVYWVIKDPVGLNYFRLQQEEYAILQMLDGCSSLDEIQRRFEARFPPQKLSLAELQQLVVTFHQSGLVLSGSPGQGERLHQRAARRQRSQLLGAAGNILAIRFRGFDPERLLGWLYARTGWVFSPMVMTACLALTAVALALVVVRFDVFQARLPDFAEFFSARNAILLAVVLAGTKVLHELGHGLACKHFGGECHEMGLMLLVLTPCLYCNVSDSWLLASKWRRAGIAAAGIVVEVVLASIATLVWWFTNPGLLHYLCLDLMFIGSVSTVLFNGNPLLRYDGYYILSDLLEIPNLRQKAAAILNRKAGQWLLGIEPPPDPFLPERRQAWFALYSVAAVVYRWLVLLAILFFLYKVFEPVRLKIVGQAIAAASLATLVVVPLVQLGRFFYVPGRVEKVKRARMLLSLAVLALMVVGVLLIKLPHHVVCTLEIQPRDAAAVYVDVSGTLAAVDVKPGDRVTPGSPLARLSDTDVELRIARLTAIRDQYQVKLANLKWQRHRDERAAAEVREIEEALQTVQEQLQKRQEEQRRLAVKAPREGTVLPPPWKPPQEDPDGKLPGWSGTPLDRQNLGCLLEGGTLLCQVGDPERMEAVLVIDQADIELVQKGQEVEILLESLPDKSLAASASGGQTARLTITEIAGVDLKITSGRLSTKVGGDLPTRTDAAGRQRPMSTSYQARVPIDDPQGLLRTGLRGTARIHTADSTLGSRLWRLAMQTVNFRL